MFKKIFIYFIILIVSACNYSKQVMQQDFGTEADTEAQLGISKKELLAVESVDDARQKASKALKKNKIDLAQAYYVKAYSMEPDNISLLQEMAQVYKALKKNDLVELCYQLILEQKPKHYKTLEQYGLLLINLKKYRQAEAKLMQVLVANKTAKNWRVLNGLGLVNDLQGNYGQAILYFTQALEINPRQIDVLNNIAFSLYRSLRYKEAIKYYKQALAVNPENQKVMYNYALLHARTKKYNIAVNLFSRLMTSAEAHNNVGYIAMKNGDLQQAYLYLQRATELSTRYYEKAYENLQTLKSLQKNEISIF